MLETHDWETRMSLGCDPELNSTKIYIDVVCLYTQHLTAETHDQFDMKPSNLVL